MELKKNPKSDLKKWSATLFNLGLAVSLGSVLVAFEWKAYDKATVKTFDGIEDNWDPIDIPITIHTPPPPPPQTPIEVIIKPDDVEIDKLNEITFDINTTEETIITEVEISSPPVIEYVGELPTHGGADGLGFGGHRLAQWQRLIPFLFCVRLHPTTRQYGYTLG